MALKVGVVGMGGIGNTHADCHKNDALADLVAVCDVVKEKADAAAEKYGVKAYYTLKDMLANEDLDIVDVTTSGYENGSWHYEPTMEALEARQARPRARSRCPTTSRKPARWCEFAADKKLYLGCNLNHYFTPLAERGKQYMDEGKLGETVYMLFKMGFNGGEESYSPNKSPRFNQPYGHMKAFLTHPFSVMRYFCGDIIDVQAFCTKPGFRKNKSDLLLSVNSVHVRFANDTVGYLLSQRGDAVWGLGGWWSCEVAGSKGTFCIENCVEKFTFWPGPSQEGEPEVVNTGVTDFGKTFPNRIHAFLEDVTNKVPLRAHPRLRPRCAGDDGVHLRRHRLLRERRRSGASARASGDPRRSSDGEDLAL